MRTAGRPIRCAIYTRKSTEEGLEQDYNSLHAQRDACAAYVQSQTGEGWTLLPAFYDDGGFSGGNMERPALRRLMTDVEAGLIDVVVVYKVDRLTRALTDFSKIVDVLDRAGASFVSVTQAFNTTTSMGRLTLNVLLSFAQFEREVTGERIRDKIAASKKLGMWMGGTLALGYDPAGRTLTINADEARTVRWVFERYLEVDSVHQLVKELEDANVVSKRWTTKAGAEKGGLRIDRGALFHMLRNRLYVGEIVHKDQAYPGQHPAIIDRAVFDAVQSRLDEKGRKLRAPGEARKASSSAPLQGLIHDTAGHLMSPVSATGKNKPTYRFYVSTPALRGEREKAGATARISAPIVEDAVVQTLRKLRVVPQDGTTDWSIIRNLVDRIDLGDDAVAVTFDKAILSHAARDLQPWERIGVDRLEPSAKGPRMIIPVVFRRRGGSRVVVAPVGQTAVKKSLSDPVLGAALVRAESWKLKLLTGQIETLAMIAAAEGVTPAYARRLIRTAFLAPDLKAAVLDGTQPAGLTLETVMRVEVPLDWTEQRQLYAGK